MDEVDWHYSRVWFGDVQLGRMRVNPLEDTLSIDHTYSYLDESGSTLILVGEVVAELPVSVDRGTPTLPGELSDWQPALDGLFDRLYCSGRRGTHCCDEPHLAFPLE